MASTVQFKQLVFGLPQIRALKRQTLALVAIDAIFTLIPNTLMPY